MAAVTTLRTVLGPDGSARSKFIDGTLLQLASTVTLGQPFEVWKTRMGRHRAESTAESFWALFRAGGVGAFYRGTGPKLVESATKGGVLIVAKDAIQEALRAAGFSQTTAAFMGGAGGGVAQTVVMGPCTFLVTAMVLGKDASATVTSIAWKTWREKGLRGFYPGGSAIAARQASNWASRVGFTEAVRVQLSALLHGRPASGRAAKRLSVPEEAVAGIIGGVLSCWNHPFEVARIEMQARALAGEESRSMAQVLRAVHGEYGVRGLFQGLLPRMGLNVWLTLFMVSGAHIVKQFREGTERRGANLATAVTGNPIRMTA